MSVIYRRRKTSKSKGRELEFMATKDKIELIPANIAHLKDEKKKFVGTVFYVLIKDTNRMYEHEILPETDYEGIRALIRQGRIFIPRP